MKLRNKISGWLSFMIIVSLSMVFFNFYSCSRKELKVYKIGAILPLTGTAGLHGEFQKNGIELAVEEINKFGGINGIPIEIVYGDSKNEAKEGISLFRNFVSVQKIPVILVTMSGVSIPMVSYLATSQSPNEKAVILATLVSAPGITEKSPYAFRCWITSTHESERLADFITKKLNMKKIAIYYVNDEYGLGALKTFKNNFEKHGNKIAWSESFSPGQTDHRSNLVRLRKINIDGVLIVGYDKAFATAIKQIREIGIKAQLFTTLGLSIKEWRDLCGDAAENAFFTISSYDVESFEQKENFNKKFISKYNKLPNVISAACYSCIYVIVEAIKNSNYSSEGIRNGLLSIKNFQTPLGSISFSEEREACPPVSICQIKNGQIILVY